jgi:hypothetical protein
MTSKTYLCVLKMFDAKTYLWHLQAFLISGAKIKKNNYIDILFHLSLTIFLGDLTMSTTATVRAIAK